MKIHGGKSICVFTGRFLCALYCLAAAVVHIRRRYRPLIIPGQRTGCICRRRRCVLRTSSTSTPPLGKKANDRTGNLYPSTTRRCAPEPKEDAQQATVFEPSANIYAPYYRQMDAAYVLSISEEERNRIASREPKADVFAALDYYFENYNHGRPYILAGHSQGSNLLTFVLAEYMKRHPERYERMIAAYVIGYSVTKDYLAQNTHLKFAAGANDTGVIVSYNTEAPVVSGDNPVLLDGGISINPISWTLDETLAVAGNNLGSMTEETPDSPTGLTLETPGIADAAVDKERGVVKCASVDRDKYEIKSVPFGSGIYHGWDYGFYYMNLRQNAAERIEAFFNKTH